MTAGRPHAILTRHFLRRFLDSDLIAPDADRSQFVALVAATCFCSTVFITVTVSCFKYVAGYYTPGMAAVASLDDKAFYIGLSMLVAALLAVSQWDALAIDARDASILEPLPIAVSTIRRAKLAAVALLGAWAALLLNLAPSLVFPMLLLVKQRVSLAGALWIVAVHAIITMAAALFGYAAIVALREVLSAMLGLRGFARVSHLLQGVLVVALGSALLLLPGLSRRVEPRLAAAPAAWAAPVWFLGAYETLAGNVLAESPRPRHVAARLTELDRRATIAYRSHRARFAALGRTAAAALLLVFAAAGAAYAWNARRLPQLAPPAAAAAHRRRWPRRWLGRAIFPHDAAARAGFWFTLAVLWRSRPHRLILACAAAAGLAVAIVALSGLDADALVRDGRVAPRLLLAQPLLFGALLIGFRHAVRVPVELRGSWGFRLAWPGRTRAFLAGARRAAVVALVLPALAAVFVLVAVVVGPLHALAHAALGFAGAIALLDALLLAYRKVPFTCAYLPDENVKALGPIYVAAYLLGASAVARIESAALATPAATVRTLLVLLAIAAALALMRRGRTIRPVEFDEAPERTQQLGLHT